ncbi:ERF family protein [Clostridium botulinum]|uniref:Recombinase n=1 Tax=Clostridium botulinum TaxID=1491 RepID=A0A9Q1UXU2_CLOBO|nr:ERF family protein [Clostridium botulinum]AEB75873.1 Essential recombination function protein [Clostridium botulinum BKT015925]KEH97189.1 recombinase [Clostridium botulinum D str. 16868]KEI04701.1 recombinase [Clostridium botulinum C/D str. Sp77]KLU76929.1 recombinase [Clostridium botulinum V891]KOA75224.1 recombinase [Clostridium botulinum]
MAVYEKLLKVQSELKAPKSQFNKFGNYAYRNCEDILESVKPLLLENKLSLMIADEILLVGDRYYIKATATIVDIETGDKESVSAFAREEENKKGMDASQLTGSTSSYARKYALNGLFCIDDTKDSDTTNTGSKTSNKTSSKKLSQAQLKRLYAIASAAGYDANVIKNQAIKKYNVQHLEDMTKTQYDELCAGYEKLKK